MSRKRRRRAESQIRSIRGAVESTVVGDPVAGEWCGECCLPSAFRLFVVVSLVANPLSTLWRGDVWQCQDCGDRWNSGQTVRYSPRASE